MCTDNKKNNQITESQESTNKKPQSENPKKQVPLKPPLLPLDEFINFNIDVEKTNDGVDPGDGFDDN